MKYGVLIAALMGVLPVAYAADSKSDFTHDAEFRVRYQYDRAIGGDKAHNTDLNTARSRFKFNTAFKSGEKFSAHVTLLHNAIWGDAMAGNSASGTPDGTGLGTQENVLNRTGNEQYMKHNGNASNMILVNQAYGVWMMNDAWSLKFGRGGFTLADGSLISRNEWQATPYSFDGLMANWEHEMFRLNLFVVKAADNARTLTTSYNKDPETNFYGLAADIKGLPEFIKTVNVHVMRVRGDKLENFPIGDGNLGIDGQTSVRYGAVVGGDFSGVDYKLVYEGHKGHTKAVPSHPPDKDTQGQMYQLDVGYSLPELMKSHIVAAYHYDSGDKSGDGKNEGYDAFYYEKHGASGWMDVLAWGNLTFLKVGYTLQPMDQMEVGLYYWNFRRSSSFKSPTANLNGGDATANGDGKGFIDASNTGSSLNLGQEIDLAVSKKYDGGLMISGLVGAFMPGSYFKDDTTASVAQNGAHKDTYFQFLLEGKMTF